MSTIKITRHHNLGHDQAIEIADDLAKDLAKRFDMHYTWQNDSLSFKRTGAKGLLKVEPHQISVQLELGLLLRPFKSRIEDEIHAHLDGLLES